MFACGAFAWAVLAAGACVCIVDPVAAVVAGVGTVAFALRGAFNCAGVAVLADKGVLDAAFLGALGFGAGAVGWAAADGCGD